MIHFETVIILTNRSVQFVLKNDDKNNIINFSCASNLKFCSSFSCWYVGTFQYCPQFSIQSFKIHRLKNNYFTFILYSVLSSP